MSEHDPRDPLADQLRAWADQAEPVSAAEARRRPKRAHRGGRALPPTRTLVLAAAAVLVLVAGVVGATVLADDDGSDVRTTDEPGPSTTLAPAPTTTSSAPEAATPTTTTVAVPRTDGGLPATWVGVDEAYRLVVVDTASGDVVRVLTTFDDPADFGNGGEGEEVASGRFVDGIAVSPDGQTVYYGTCCEPAAGQVYRLPITGGEPEPVAMGTGFALSPDGSQLAAFDPTGIFVLDLATGVQRTHRDADLAGQPCCLAWTPTGTRLLVTRRVATSADLATSELEEHLFDVVEGPAGTNPLADGRLLGATGDASAFRAYADEEQGHVIFQRLDDEGNVVGMAEVARRLDHGDAVYDEVDPVLLGYDRDAANAHPIRTFGDRTVTAVDDDAQEVALGAGYVDAAW